MSQHRTDASLIELDFSGRNPFERKVLAFSENFIDKILGISRINRLYSDIVNDAGPGNFCQKSLRALNVGLEIEPGAISRIPKEGGLVVVANHPFGGIEGVALAQILLSVRPDVKFIVNYLLARIPEMRDLFFTVDPFGNKASAAANVTALREAIRWVRGGGVLAVFPAGEVSHWRTDKAHVTDPEWRAAIGAVIRRAQAQVLPVFFHGRNSVLFQVTGLAHPRLRTALLAQELLKSKNRTLRISIGNKIPFGQIENFKSNEEVMGYLRLRTYLMENRSTRAERRRPSRILAPIVPPPSVGVIEKEIESLREDQILLRGKETVAAFAKAGEIPNLLLEIGRQREIAFRAEGEGTGRCIDLDRFDEDYLHLFVWNTVRRELVGGYRFCRAGEIFNTRGKSGLYTASLFRFDHKFLNRLDGALELGRSYVTLPYQKSFSALFLLWRAISRYVACNPKYHTLFGPVSISPNYSDPSRRVMVDFLTRTRFCGSVAAGVKPRNTVSGIAVKGWNLNSQPYEHMTLEHLSGMIKDIEKEQAEIPILIKHYLRLGGEFLGFNVDAKFGHTVDGLILVDLLKSDTQILKTYMGEEPLKAFRNHHGILTP